jgi:maltose O-acetyltransferase
MPSHKKLSEREKMLVEELYTSADPELRSLMASAQKRLRRLNDTPNERREARFKVLRSILASVGHGTEIKSPFSCDYGKHIRIGRNGFINYGCVFLDCNFIQIGDDAQVGPGVHIYTAHHPVDPEKRRKGLEGARPVNIGHNVWLGGRTVICPGVSIGENSVIGAASVVLKNIPANCLAVGNPCRVIRELK